MITEVSVFTKAPEAVLTAVMVTLPDAETAR